MSRPKPGARFRGKAFGGGFGDAATASQTGVSDQLIKNARQSGQLNLSGRGLAEVPEKVWRINLDAAADAREVSFESSDRWWDQNPLSKLILASNKLTALSPDVRLLPALLSLDVHDNQLTSLPDTLNELENIQKLNISHNKLETLPDSLCNCIVLSFLHVEHNSLTHLPNEIGNLVNLDDLDVSHNQLTELPSSIGELQGLSKLNLSNNKLDHLPDQIQFLKGITMLDLTHNQLTSLPDAVGMMRSLEQLYVRHNKLRSMPLLHNCSKLKELHLGNNLLSEFGADQLKCLSEISVLDVRDNKINKVPEEITLLTRLERLDISNNDVSTLPYEMGNMSKLKSLVVDGNPMRGIRRDIISRGSEGIKRYLRSRIEVVETAPESAVQQSHGQSGVFGGGDQIDAHSVKQSKALEYSGKKAAAIPEDVWELGIMSEVSQINFSKNQLQSWPIRLAELAERATSVNLGFNRLTILPEQIGIFQKLTDLDLRNNLLTTLPGEIRSLTNLRTLTLSFNRFGEIPAVVYELSSLETLLMSDNQVATISAEGLQNLPKLTSLDLQNNNLSSIPAELGLCEGLRSLLLVGNPCKNPRPAMLTKGTVALLEYLRGRIVQ